VGRWIVPRKRLSGAQRRAFARAIKAGAFFGLLRPGKSGRPKGLAGRTEKRRERLHKDLAWIGRPDLSDLALARMLLTDRKYRDGYRGISERSLRREVALAQRRIWGAKMRGANILANKNIERS
jgi:hypothetical protein